MNDERYQAMLAMHDEGATFQQIGDSFGVSRQRVHQILGSRGLLHGERDLYKAICDKGRWMTEHEIAVAMGHRNEYLSEYTRGILGELIRQGKILKRKSNFKYEPMVYKTAE